MDRAVRSFLSHLIYWPGIFVMGAIFSVLEIDYGVTFFSTDWGSILAFTLIIGVPIPFTYLPWIGSA